MDPNYPTTPGIKPQRSRGARRWAAGIASTLAAALLAGGGVAVALQSQDAQQNAQQNAAQNSQEGQQASQAGADESLASLTSLADLAGDVTTLGTDQPADAAQPASLVEPAAATPSPSSSASPSAKHPARTALRRVLAVIIRQDGSAQYGQHAQTAARALINRFPGAFRRLPEKLRQDLWTLAGAAPGQEVSDAETIKNNALNGTYGAAVQKLAEAIKNAPAKPSTTSPAPSASATPSPSATSGS